MTEKEKLLQEKLRLEEEIRETQEGLGEDTTSPDAPTKPTRRGWWSWREKILAAGSAVVLGSTGVGIHKGLTYKNQNNVNQKKESERHTEEKPETGKKPENKKNIPTNHRMVEAIDIKEKNLSDNEVAVRYIKVMGLEPGYLHKDFDQAKKEIGVERIVAGIIKQENCPVKTNPGCFIFADLPGQKDSGITAADGQRLAAYASRDAGIQAIREKVRGGYKKGETLAEFFTTYVKGPNRKNNTPNRVTINIDKRNYVIKDSSRPKFENPKTYIDKLDRISKWGYVRKGSFWIRQFPSGSANILHDNGYREFIDRNGVKKPGSFLEEEDAKYLGIEMPDRATRKKIEIEEGCLSLPGIFGMVKRPKKVTIQAQNLHGEKVEITDEGWISRVAQHEIDHTNGILIIDLIKKYTKGGISNNYK
jgi:peptide deformylase